MRVEEVLTRSASPQEEDGFVNTDIEGSWDHQLPPGTLQRPLMTGGNIPHESIRRSMSFMPLAAAQFHPHVLDIVSDHFRNGCNIIAKDFSLGYYGSNEDQVKNCGRELMVAFKYPRNGKHIITGKQNVFKHFICGCIGTADDCYVMNASSVRKALT